MVPLKAILQVLLWMSVSNLDPMAIPLQLTGTGCSSSSTAKLNSFLKEKKKEISNSVIK